MLLSFSLLLLIHIISLLSSSITRYLYILTNLLLFIYFIKLILPSSHEVHFLLPYHAHNPSRASNVKYYIVLLLGMVPIQIHYRCTSPPTQCQLYLFIIKHILYIYMPNKSYPLKIHYHSGINITAMNQQHQNECCNHMWYYSTTGGSEIYVYLEINANTKQNALINPH